MTTHSALPLVLASASEARAQLLRNAGVPFLQETANVNEAVLKATHLAAGSPPEVAAVALAEAKAIEVAARHPGALVIGADQLLIGESTWFDKPLTRERARATLESLRGRSYRLVSGMAVACDGIIEWRHVEVATMRMRPYTNAFIDWYLDHAEASALHAVGACRLEGLGAQALERVDGDYFTILGLPLLPLLAFLRHKQMLFS
jgi:nucleoside triphosphate pyrophosphatase